MDAVSYSLASKQAQRIEKFIENPDSTSGIVTVPKTIASGETITIPAGRVAVLPNLVVDGTLNIDGEVFIPSGSTYDNVIDHSTLPTATTELVSTDFVVVLDDTVPKKITLSNFTQELTASSETVAGVIELATTAEAQAGTDDLRAITPLKLKNSVIGLGQTWQDVTASRALWVTYINSTGKPITVSISWNSTSGGVTVTVGGVQIVTGASGGGSFFTTAFIVPNASTYIVGGGNGIYKWAELR